MTIDNNENLIINIGGKTQCISKKDLTEQLEFIQEARKVYQQEKTSVNIEPQTFCAKYNRDNEELVKEENKIEPNYYMKYKIIPLDFILANSIPFVEANVIKYVCRWKDKNGVEDLKKAISYLEKLIKNEENGNK